MYPDQQFQAIYFACISWDEEPSVRNIVARFKVNNNGKGVRSETVRAWLAAYSKRDTPGTHREHTPDTVTLVKNSKRDTPGTQSVSLRARGVKVLSNIIPLVSIRPNGLIDTPSPVTDDKKPIKPTVPDVTFDEFENDVTAFMASVAADNKSGTVTTARVRTIRMQLAAARIELGTPAWLAGLRTCNERGVGNLNYLRRVAEHHNDDRPLAPVAASTNGSYSHRNGKREPGAWLRETGFDTPEHLANLENKYRKIMEGE